MKESSVDKWMFSGKEDVDVRTELVQLREDSGGEVETRYKVGAKNVQCMVGRRKAGVEEEQRMVG